MTLGEDVLILLEKSRERLEDRRSGKGANPSCSFWSGIVKKYLFKFLNGLRHRSMFFYGHGLEMVVHLQHSYVALVCSHLISKQFSNFIINREFDH